jgi:hypothetical protein
MRAAIACKDAGNKNQAPIFLCVLCVFAVNRLPVRGKHKNRKAHEVSRELTARAFAGIGPIL